VLRDCVEHTPKLDNQFSKTYDFDIESDEDVNDLIQLSDIFNALYPVDCRILEYQLQKITYNGVDTTEDDAEKFQLDSATGEFELLDI
jgi:hypothetical protein